MPHKVSNCPGVGSMFLQVLPTEVQDFIYWYWSEVNPDSLKIERNDVAG